MGSPVTGIFVSIDKEFQDEIVTPSGFKLWLDGTYNKNFTASVTGKITALPITAKSEQHKNILRQLKIGDEVAFSYKVVSDIDYVSDGDQFMPSTEGDEQYREWVTGRGEKLHAYCLKNQRTWSDIWIGYHLDRYNQHVDGIQGSQEDLEKWLSQFPIGKTDRYTHTNLFEFNGKKYWKCELDQIFAKKVDGKPVSVSNRVICLPVEEQVPLEVKQYLVKFGEDAKVRFYDRGKVVSGHTNLDGVKRGDTVMFPERFLEKYEIWGKEYFLVNKMFVHSKI